LWADPQWYVEEQFSGLQVTVTVTPTHNMIEANGDKVHHSFHQYRDAKLYDALRYSVFTGVLTAPEGLGRKYIKTLIDSGVMGAERLQRENGQIRLVLTDVMMLGGVDFSGFKFKDRRIYLESMSSLLVERGLVPSVVISDVIKTDKLQFYDFICDRGARGVILKDSNGIMEDKVFKVATKQAGKGVGNVTLTKNWQSLEKKIEPLEEFDYDSYLAVQFLNQPRNELKLASVIS
jgi:hypothetical protein